MKTGFRRFLQAMLIVEMALAVTFTIIWSYRLESVLLASAGSLFAWLGLLSAHYLETGQLADKAESHAYKVDPIYPVLVLGVFMMVAAFPTAILGVHMDSSGVIFAGELTFFSGFAVGHYGLARCFF